MTREYKHLDTRLVHAGEPRPRIRGAVVLPIFQSSTYDYAGQADYHDVKYARLSNNPNHEVLHRKIAALESTEDALVASSGMAAISTTLLTVLSSGDHVLAQDCLYGGTHGLLTKDFPSWGISHDFIDPRNPASWEAALRPSTRAIYIETLANPLLEMADVERIVEFARAHSLVSLIDNTFASPVNFRPAEWGFDFVLESATKYLNGHSDLIAGAVAASKERIRAVKRRLDHLGGSLDPHACFLLQRGLKTLGVRVRRQSDSALRIARYLAGHPAVERVNYPGLDNHPQHARAARMLDGFGGMVSFELSGGAEAAERMFSRVAIATVAVSLGGPETLLVRPAAAVHSNLSAAEREASGISDGLVRLSVGLEAPDELIEDFAQALDHPE